MLVRFQVCFSIKFFSWIVLESDDGLIVYFQMESVMYTSTSLVIWIWQSA